MYVYLITNIPRPVRHAGFYGVWFMFYPWLKSICTYTHLSSPKCKCHSITDGITAAVQKYPHSTSKWWNRGSDTACIRVMSCYLVPFRLSARVFLLTCQILHYQTLKQDPATPSFKTRSHSLTLFHLIVLSTVFNLGAFFCLYCVAFLPVRWPTLIYKSGVNIWSPCVFIYDFCLSFLAQPP